MKFYMKSNNSSWDKFFDSVKNKKYFRELQTFLDIEYKNKTIYPEKNNIFRCFDLCSFNDLKVIILGQDPYHEPNQANGLCFSVNNGIKFPPSLVNIYKEIENEYNTIIFDKDSDLSYLAKQGVLLLNKYLTVEKGKPLSHKNELYDMFFNDLIQFIETNNKPIVYLLWGGEAKKVKKIITNPNHKVIETNHPSPLSANRGGWFNSNCFKNCNVFLENNNINPIKWF